ncbi:probable G-protein coupled receptor 139 [Heterodontus francisci]|uniref:probable G-protein coupled receptor 139 n=1 Tax=Heterodontus francisci TaxID=7792 RepID=UPI00355C0A0E
MESTKIAVGLDSHERHTVSMGESSLALTGISGSREREKMDQNLSSIDSNVTIMGLNLRTIDWIVKTLDQNRRPIYWNVTIMGRSLSDRFDHLTADYYWLTLENRIYYGLKIIQYFYYPTLAVFGVPVNLLTIRILFWGKCGLFKSVTHYLVAMAVADLLDVILDLTLRHIPILYREHFEFLRSIPVYNIHAVLLYTATDCSVWFSVTFTFDRFVAICCQKLKSKYCSEKTAAVVLGTVTVLSRLKNITWYFMFTGWYRLVYFPWFCAVAVGVYYSRVWGTIEFIHSILTPAVPFVVILLLNTLTVRHIILRSRARRRLRTHSSGESRSDPQMDSRRKSIILLLVISANFVLLWAVLLVYSIWWRMWLLRLESVFLAQFLREAGFMLQLLSCCTNTAIYAVTQTQFREQLKNILKYPFTPIVKLVQ